MAIMFCTALASAMEWWSCVAQILQVGAAGLATALASAATRLAAGSKASRLLEMSLDNQDCCTDMFATDLCYRIPPSVGI